MIRNIATVLFTAFIISTAQSQDTLNTIKYKDAELFVQKKGYDVQQRLAEIKDIAGKEVTVFEVSGKQNKIKLTYTGIAEMATVEKFSDADRASLIVVRTKEANGMERAYFPMTNDHLYRII